MTELGVASYVEWVSGIAYTRGMTAFFVGNGHNSA